MKIIPNRNMHLDGRRVEKDKVETVSKDEGELAIRHGWAALPEPSAANAGSGNKGGGNKGGGADSAAPGAAAD